MAQLEAGHKYGAKLAEILGLGKYVRKIVIEVAMGEPVKVYAQKFLGQGPAVLDWATELMESDTPVEVIEVKEVQVDERGNVQVQR